MPTIRVTTKPCMMCGHPSVLEIDETAYRLWLSGALVQRAFPDLPKETRELLITGTHPTCWEKMFEDSEE